MSRKITRDAVSALYGDKGFKRSNTEVVHGYDGREKCASMYLFNKEIVRIDGGKLSIRTAGWATSTTKERLNGLPGVSIYQKDFQWYLNDRPWEDHYQWTAVERLRCACIGQSG